MNDWIEDGIFRKRNYASYGIYLESQASKLTSKHGFAKRVDQDLEPKLYELLRLKQLTAPGMSVLCLGARLGGEVRAFQKLGCFAVGIDINPGENNQSVLHGDFHTIQFANGSLDMVYWNCMDHALYPKKVFAEIRRVLKMNGRLILELKAGYSEKPNPKMSDHWDCLEWPSNKAIQGIVESIGFVSNGSYYYKQNRSHPFGYIFGRR